MALGGFNQFPLLSGAKSPSFEDAHSHFSQAGSQAISANLLQPVRQGRTRFPAPLCVHILDGVCQTQGGEAA
jgi:hypothetical protein